MSDREPLPMSPELRELVTAERDVPPAPAEGRERVRKALEGSLFGLPGGGGDDGGGTGEGAAVATRRSGRLASLGTAAIAGAVAGAVLTYGVMASRGSSTPPAATALATSVAVPEPPAVVPSGALSFSLSPALAAPSASSSAAAARREPVLDSANAERAILDPARAALARGDATTALDATRAHEAAFPGGKLAEEREAIAVQALVVLHRGAEAKQRGARFLAKYPSSVLAPVVQAALANAD